MDILTHPILQAFFAGLGPFMAISFGAAGIFLRKEFSRKAIEIMLGAAAGMMLGATFWSLIMPSLDLSADFGRLAFLPTMVGLILGTLFLRCFDAILPHTHGLTDTTEGLSTNWHRSILLIAAMALHHIPEGLAVGVSYGAASLEHSMGPSTHEAMLLMLSIMLQGMPEGLVVAVLLRGDGHSPMQSFIWGSLSGITTPIGAAMGAFATGLSTQLLPVALAFAAGAMLYIIVEDIIPESQSSGHGNNATIAVIGGLILIMIFNSVFA